MNLRRIYEKNRLEIRALATGRLPRFILQGGDGGRLDEVPVFFFHGVDPDRLDRQLGFLAANGYRTLSGGELARAWVGKPDRVAALTFDDATWTFWAHAYPLLVRRGMKAILFAIPGLVPEGPRHANLADTWSGTASPASVHERARSFPLCTWSELEEMHASGVVDIQSHSWTHQLVPVSPRVVGFQHPGFNADYYGNVLLPVAGDEDPRAPRRELRLGAPILESSPRLAGLPRYREPAAVSGSLTAYVASQGGAAFFERSGWERELRSKLAGANAAGGGAYLEGGTYESVEDCATLVRHELAESRRVLEARLPGHAVRHFCYPWFAGSDLSDGIAHEVGYEALHYGIEPRLEARFRGVSEPPYRIARISEEYLERLPGRGRVPLPVVWSDRLLKRGHPRGLEA